MKFIILIICLVFFVSVSFTSECSLLIDPDQYVKDAPCYYYSGVIGKDGISVVDAVGNIVSKGVPVYPKVESSVCIGDSKFDLTGLNRKDFFDKYIVLKNQMQGIFFVDVDLYNEFLREGEFIDTGKFEMRTKSLLARLKACSRFAATDDLSVLEIKSQDSIDDYLPGYPQDFDTKKFLALPIVDGDIVATGTIVNFEDKTFVFTVEHANLADTVIFSTVHGNVCGKRLLNKPFGNIPGTKSHFPDLDVFLLNGTFEGMELRFIADTKISKFKYRGYNPAKMNIVHGTLEDKHKGILTETPEVFFSKCESYPGMSGSPMYLTENDRYFLYGMIQGQNRAEYCGIVTFHQYIYDFLSNYDFSQISGVSCRAALNPSYIIKMYDWIMGTL